MMTLAIPRATQQMRMAKLKINRDSIAIYGDPANEADGLLESIREHGILVPLVVAKDGEVLSGHRRLACARILGIRSVPCEVRDVPRGEARRRAVIEYNQQRQKTFRQHMREADVLEAMFARDAKQRREANLIQNRADGRNSDHRRVRTDTEVAKVVGLAGKISTARLGRFGRRPRRVIFAHNPALDQLDAGTKTIHAAYKDLRRRDRFAAGFRPTPYDVWSCRHDRAFGIPHPGSIPASIVRTRFITFLHQELSSSIPWRAGERCSMCHIRWDGDVLLMTSLQLERISHVGT